MRICLLSREYPPDTGWGGIATYTYHQAQALMELGHDVEVIALTADQSSDKDTTATDEKGVVVNRVSYRQLSELHMLQKATPFSHYVLSASASLGRKLEERESIKSFDVIEAPEHLAEGLTASLVKTAPLVVRLHTPQSKIIAEGFHNVRSSFDQEFVAMIERVAIVNADAITSPSLDMAEYVSTDTGIPIADIKIVRNQVDEIKFHPTGEVALENKAKKIVLTVGRLEPRKGVNFLIDAIPLVVQEYPQVQFIIIGADTKNEKGQHSTLMELKAKLERNHCSDYVTFIPQVPLDQLPAYYRSCDLFVIPSLYDNAPMTCLEAMSSGKAVIATSAGGTKEYAINDECGIVVPPADSQTLARAILKLMRDNAMRQAFGAAARRKVETGLTKKHTALESIPVYESAISNFKLSQKFAQYRRNDSFQADISGMLKAYDKMLYDFMFQQSLAFRLKHKFAKLKSRLLKN